MARIYPVSHSPDGRFSGRTNRCDGIRHGDDPRWSEFLLDALLRILRWQTGRRKNRPILAQTGYDKKRDQPSSSLHCGVARLRRYTALDCPLYHSSLDVLHSKQAGELCADTVALGLGMHFVERLQYRPLQVIRWVPQLCHPAKRQPRTSAHCPVSGRLKSVDALKGE